MYGCSVQGSGHVAEGHSQKQSRDGELCTFLVHLLTPTHQAKGSRICWSANSPLPLLPRVWKW